MTVTPLPLAALGTPPTTGSPLRSLVLLFPAHALLLVPVGALVMSVFSGFSRLAIDYAVDDPLRTGGVGLLTIAPVAALAAVVLVAVPRIFVLLAGAAGFFVLPVLIAAEAYAAVTLGAALLSPFDRGGRWSRLVVGSVPILVAWLLFPWGWPVGGAFVALGIGAVARATWVTLDRRA